MGNSASILEQVTYAVNERTPSILPPRLRRPAPDLIHSDRSEIGSSYSNKIKLELSLCCYFKWDSKWFRTLSGKLKYHTLVMQSRCQV